MRQLRRIHRREQANSLKPWEQWVTVTIISEIVGLVLIVAIEAISRRFALNLYGLLVLLGAIEGTVLGCAQWLVLRHYIRHAAWWILATLVGAMIAWLAGLFVSIVLAIATVTSSPGQQTSQLFTGIVLQGVGVGILLGYSQWLVLQAHIRDQILQKAFWWLLANVSAWVLPLLIAFWGAGRLEAALFDRQTAFVVALTGGMMGAIVGAITGIALVRILKPRTS